MLWPVLGLILVAFAIALPLTALLVRLGYKVNALDSAGVAGHVKQLRRVPNIGGIAIYAAIGLPLAAGLLVLQLTSDQALVQLVPAIEPHLGRIDESLPTAFALLIGMTVLHLVGLVDDRRSLGPAAKLAAQLAVAAMMAIWFDVRLLTFLDAQFSLG